MLDLQKEDLDVKYNKNKLNIFIMNTQREQFVENVKKWVYIDSQIKQLNEKIKKLREFKNDITPNICNYISENNNSNTIEISDGELKIFDKKEYEPLTFLFLEKRLSEIITNEEQVDYIIQYLKDNREVKNTTDIKRTFNK